MINIENKIDCCGCSACAGVCPKQCITMQPDSEGFYYPSLNLEQCIDCGACNRVCPVLHPNAEDKIDQEGYIVQHINSDVLRESTAGGAFTAIAQYVIAKGGVVFGAALDNGLMAKHICVEKEEDLIRYRNSKYMQSLVDEKVFRQVRDYLKNGRMVCFSGTPCQIEGLKNFLYQEYENLITVDVVCRAVPSPFIFRKYLDVQKKRLGEKIQNVRFRDKYYGYKYSTMNIVTEQKKGQYHEGVESDLWLRTFFSNICNRPSCYECRFKKQYRVSDFTIGDCFSVGRFSKELDNDLGATKILIHSEKGKELFQKISDSVHYVNVEPDKLFEGCAELTHSVAKNEKREIFMADAVCMGSEELFQKYFPITFKSKAEHLVRIICYKIGIYSLMKKLYVRVTHKY